MASPRPTLAERRERRVSMAKRHKNPNGAGGVTYHAPSKRFRARLTVDGREVSRKAPTKREAERLLAELRRQRDAGLSIDAGRTTVADYLSGWLDSRAALGKVRERTLEGYRQHVRDHLTPALGRVTLAALSRGHVQRMIDRLAASGLSPSTVQRIRATLRAALTDAERKGAIDRNPARLVDLPKVRRKPPEAMEPATAAAILEAVKGHRLEALIVVAMFTGCRQGELLGLPWKAVDLAAGRLTVGLALSRRRAAAPVLTEPKTERSRRTLPLPPAAVEALRAHAERQRFEERKVGAAWDNAAGLVFVAEDGRPLESSVALWALRRSLAAAGLPKMRFHDLRHAYATLTLQTGASLREVMEGLGHSDIGTTGNVYAHIAPATMRRVADDLEALVRGAAAAPSEGAS